MAAKAKPKQVSVKIDREDYDRVLVKAKAGMRPIASQMRLIISDWFEEITIMEARR